MVAVVRGMLRSRWKGDAPRGRCSQPSDGKEKERCCGMRGGGVGPVSGGGCAATAVCAAVRVGAVRVGAARSAPGERRCLGVTEGTVRNPTTTPILGPTSLRAAPAELRQSTPCRAVPSRRRGLRPR